RLARLLRQLALHLRPRSVFRAVPAALAVPPPLVALGRGAVLPLLAVDLRRRDERLRPTAAAGRGAGRGARFAGPRLDPPHPRRRPASLLRGRNARRRAARRCRPGALLESAGPAAGPAQPLVGADPRPAGGDRARLRRHLLPRRPRIRPRPVP